MALQQIIYGWIVINTLKYNKQNNINLYRIVFLGLWGALVLQCFFVLMIATEIMSSRTA